MSSARPQVSVVIPAYNQAQYLEAALASVFAQTFPVYEIIIVDDGSIDRTAEIAQEAARQNPDRVRTVTQENQGLAGARNTGIRLARGAFVALLDSDDLWEPQFLSRMAGLIEQHPDGDIYYCGWQAIDQAGKPLPQGGNRVEPPEQMYPALLRANFLNCSGTIMRRETIMDAGLFDPAFRRLQDWEFWLRLLRDGRRFIGLPERLVRYRMHASSLSMDPAGGQRAALALANKLFGPDDGAVASWSADKRRAFGGVYRYHALSSVIYSRDWEACARHLRSAFQVDPTLASDESLYYELAFGSQPLGQRGVTQNLDLEENAARLTQTLESAFAAPVPAQLAGLRHLALAKACFVLGRVAYNLNLPGLTRRYLLQALKFRPALAADPRLGATFARSLLDRSSLERLRRLRRSWQ